VPEITKIFLNLVLSYAQNTRGSIFSPDTVYFSYFSYFISDMLCMLFAVFFIELHVLLSGYMHRVSK